MKRECATVNCEDPALPWSLYCPCHDPDIAYIEEHRPTRRDGHRRPWAPQTNAMIEDK